MATEFGFVGKGEPGAHIPCISDETYGDTIMSYLKSKGISYTLWCFDPQWAPTLFTDWNFTPSRQGKYFKEKIGK